MLASGSNEKVRQVAGQRSRPRAESACELSASSVHSTFCRRSRARFGLCGGHSGQRETQCPRVTVGGLARPERCRLSSSSPTRRRRRREKARHGQAERAGAGGSRGPPAHFRLFSSFSIFTRAVSETLAFGAVLGSQQNRAGSPEHPHSHPP